MVLIIPSISQLSLEGAKLLLGQGPHCDLDIGALILYARTLWGAIGSCLCAYIHVYTHTRAPWGTNLSKVFRPLSPPFHFDPFKVQDLCFRFWHKMRNKITNIISRLLSHVPYPHAIYMLLALVILLYVSDKTPLFHCLKQENVFNSPMRSCLVHGLI